MITPLLACVLALTLPAPQTTWSEIPQVMRRYGHAMAYDSARGITLLFGGQSTASLRDDLWAWDGSTWRTVPADVRPEPRVYHTLVYDAARDRVVLFGGSYLGARNDTWEWDGTRWILLNPQTRPVPRVGHAMVYDPNRQRTVLFGGTDNRSWFNDTWEWDGTNWRSLSSPSLPPGREGHALAYDVQRQRTVLFGGWDVTTGAMNDTWEWDGASWSLAATTGPPARSSHVMAYDPVGRRCILLGGNNGFNLPSDMWAWDGLAWVLVSSSAPTRRILPSIAVDTNRGRCVLFGGTNQSDMVDAETWEWTGNAWQLRHRPDAFLGRDDHCMFYDGASVIAFGGQNRSRGILRDTLRWDGTTWTTLLASQGPGPRFDHAAVQDERLGVALLFGGDNGVQGLNDTWQWDRVRWTPLAPPQSPPPRAAHSMAYDPSRGRTVLFGGTNGVSDTWEYDGSTWIQQPTGSSPAPRMYSSMAYDTVRRAVVLFGGVDVQSPILFGDTWAWDGTQWTRLTPATSPSPRAAALLVRDPARERLVLFAGLGTLANDTWEWDGSRWIQRAPPIAPPGRIYGSGAYDFAREQIVMMGGGVGGTQYDDTWVYRPTNPARFELHYTACPGTTGIPLLSSPGRPWIGETFEVRVSNVPPSSAAAMLVGFSATQLFGQYPLPLELSVLGMPGCRLYTDIAIAAPMNRTTQGLSWNFLVCSCPPLLGLTFYVQALVTDPMANPAGMILTRGASASIGGK